MAIQLLAACTTPEQRKRDELADRIEALVRLPKGAGRLADYARAYAFDDKGLVVGVYVPGYVAPKPDETCEQVLGDLKTREVPCPPETSGERLRSGQRRWVDDINKLPMVMDGGCSVVTVTYDLKRGVIQDTYCNGVA